MVPGFERQLAGMGGKLQVTKCAYESASAVQRAFAPADAKVSEGGKLDGRRS